MEPTIGAPWFRRKQHYDCAACDSSPDPLDANCFPMIELPGTKEPKAEIENGSPMSCKKPKRYLLFCLLLTGFATIACKGSAQQTSDRWTPAIPKAWDEAALAEWATP